ncbi:MAG: nuclear transport factor 2 family protein [Acidimicrobiia bacterium]
MPDPSTAQAMDAIFGRHMDAELAGDLDETLATMTANPHLVNVPTMVGGAGPEGVRDFYANRLIGQFFPPDAEFVTVSRTFGDGQLVDELVISFTHTITMDWMLPGVEPTGRPVSVAFVVIVGVDGDKIAYEHIHWDQATVLVQLGLLDPAGLPVAGREAAAKLLDPTIPGPHFSASSPRPPRSQRSTTSFRADPPAGE